jgi:hypothetical protein
MDWKNFFVGVGLIAAAYLIYRDVKGKHLFSEGIKPDIVTTYYKSWSAVIVFIVVGIYFIITSFQS